MKMSFTAMVCILNRCWFPPQLLEWQAVDCASTQSGINYHWSDGSDTVYTHWDSTDDDEDIVTGDCVYMDVSGGWRRADCDTLLPGALCDGLRPSQCYCSDISKTFCISSAVCAKMPTFFCTSPPLSHRQQTDYLIRGGVSPHMGEIWTKLLQLWACGVQTYVRRVKRTLQVKR